MERQRTHRRERCAYFLRRHQRALPRPRGSESLRETKRERAGVRAKAVSNGIFHSQFATLNPSDFLLAATALCLHFIGNHREEVCQQSFAVCSLLLSS